MTRHSLTYLLCLSILTACIPKSQIESEKPSENVVRHIEEILAETDCYAPLSRWARYYYFPRRLHDPYKQDRRFVVISFKQAGAFEFKSGTFIVGHLPEPGIDDRDYGRAHAVYDLASESIKFDYCKLQ